MRVTWVWPILCSGCTDPHLRQGSFERHLQETGAHWKHPEGAKSVKIVAECCYVCPGWAGMGCLALYDKGDIRDKRKYLIGMFLGWGLCGLNSWRMCAAAGKEVTFIGISEKMSCILCRTHSDHLLVPFKDVAWKSPIFGDRSIIALSLLNFGCEFDELCNFLIS